MHLQMHFTSISVSSIPQTPHPHSEVQGLSIISKGLQSAGGNPGVAGFGRDVGRHVRLDARRRD